MPELLYIHDPMCSWCWGFNDTYKKLINNLDSSISVKRLLGGLAPDSDEPMSDATRLMVQNAWHRIEKNIPNKKFNFDFWEQNIPRRSTYPACRAVIAAREQGAEFDEIMTYAIQNAYYQQAKNPSDLNVLINLANDIGLSIQLFEKSINSKETQNILYTEINQAKKRKVESFPSLVLVDNQSAWSIPIDYNDEQPILETIDLLIAT